MLMRRFKVFRLFGFDVYVDMSWFIIALLVTWSLATGVFPAMYPAGLESPGALWAMGVAGALALFASIILHEMAHAVTARYFGLRMRGITLFIFGGVAEMVDEPPSPKAEFWVAIAGPIMSVLIGAGLWASLVIPWPLPVRAVVAYLAVINLILAGFNMIPAFPLDGGRVLRSILWALHGNLRRATRITSSIGALFGIAIMAWGVVAILQGDFMTGMWRILIGMFLRQAAQMSYQQLLLRRALEGETVARFMRPNPVKVPPDTTIADLVDHYIYVHHHKMFPVADNGHLLGCVTTQRVRDVPRDQWPLRTVAEVADQCAPDNTVSSDTDAMEALAKMNRTGASRLLVVDHDQLVGVLTLKDLMKFMSLKVELEDA